MLSLLCEALDVVRNYLCQTSGFLFEYKGIKFKGDNMELREGQEVIARAELKTRSGKPAAYQVGSATWTSSNPDVAFVNVVADDELQAVIQGIDGSENESVVIEFRVDGDPDLDEDREIILTASVTVTQGEAVVGELILGEPTESDLPEIEPEEA